MDPTTAVIGVLLALAALIGVIWGLVAWARGTRDSDVALQADRADRAEALAESRRRLLEVAREDIAAGHSNDEAAIRRFHEREQKLMDAARGDPAAVDAVVDELLRAEADRRARREAAAHAAAAVAEAKPSKDPGNVPA